jgi:Domain of unknown function (DUF4352)
MMRWCERLGAMLLFAVLAVAPSAMRAADGLRGPQENSRAGAGAALAAPLAAHREPIGSPLSTIIIFGNQYEGGDELYDAKITVLEVVRGKKAWDTIREANASNAPPKAGWEYVVARVRFEYTARTKPGQQTYAVNASQFIATSASGTDYPPANLTAEAKPELNATLHSGESAEGWVAVEIPQSDRRPLMIFQADTGSVFHEGDGSVFQLYESAQGAKAKAAF